MLLSIESSEFPLLFERRDSTFSVNSDYSDENGHDEQNSTLNAWQGAALLTADCLGTGLLALPNNIYTLGVPLGLGFLICNLPINYYAGWIFHRSALAIEEQHVRENLAYSSASNTTVSKSSDTDVDDEGHEQSQRNYQSVSNRPTDDNNNNNNDKSAAKIDTTAILVEQPHQQQQQRSPPPAMLHHDTATYDFIGMTAALFPDNKTATRRVMGIYYTNIFLVMGNYILVMSHAVAAAVGEERVSLPVAGLIAATAMFVVLSQFRTMAKLGRYASLVSLSALLTVVLQCLWEVRQQQRLFPMILPPPPFETVIATESTIMHRLRKLSALGSIGFSIGSQKLFLNIRHELTDRRDAPKSLAISLSVFGTAYVLLVAAAGPNPPGFLFDAIPVHTWNRHVAGILLWMHVVVSYGASVIVLLLHFVGARCLCCWRQLLQYLKSISLAFFRAPLSCSYYRDSH